jgi:hypothetical protein
MALFVAKQRSERPAHRFRQMLVTQLFGELAIDPLLEDVGQRQHVGEALRHDAIL